MTDSSFEGRLDRVEALVEANSRSIDRLAEYQAETFRSLRELATFIEQVGQRVDQTSARVDSLAAASERYDRILDYLMRRDGERPE